MDLSPTARSALAALYSYVSEVDAVGTIAQIGVHSALSPFQDLLDGLEELAELGLALKNSAEFDYSLWSLNRVDEVEAVLFSGPPVARGPRSRRSALAG